MGKARARIPIYIGVWMVTLLCGSGLQAQLTANANFNPSRIETGDTFSLRVLVTGTNSEPQPVDFKPWAAVFQGNNILSHTGWRRSGAQWVQQFTLIGFDSVQTELPPLLIKSHLGETIPTNALLLDVFPTKAGTEIGDMDSIREIIREPVSWQDFWPWYIGVGILLLVAMRYLRKPKRPKPQIIQQPVAAVEPAIPIHIAALQRLAELEKQKAWTKGPIKAYYVELSMIMREYLEKRFQIPALESTTSETKQMLAHAAVPTELLQSIEKLLAQTDLVKYASHIPAPDAHLKALHHAQTIIEKTHA